MLEIADFMRKVNADLHNHLKSGVIIKDMAFDGVVERVRQRLDRGGILGVTNFVDITKRFSTDHLHRKVFPTDFHYEQMLCHLDCEKENFGWAFYVPEKDILVVKGDEVVTKDGHVLALGIEEYKTLKADRPVEETLREARAMGAINVLVHPCSVAGIGKKKLLEVLKYSPEFVDAVEVHNSQAVWIPKVTPRHANRIARAVYTARALDWGLDIGSFVSSDGDSVREIGTSYMTLDMPSYKGMKPEMLKETLRRAVRGHKDLKGKVRRNELGMLLHGAAVCGYYPLMKKLTGSEVL